MEGNIHEPRPISPAFRSESPRERKSPSRVPVVPVARLVALEPKAKRPLGFARGEIWIADDFDPPWPMSCSRRFTGARFRNSNRNPKRPGDGDTSELSSRHHALAVGCRFSRETQPECRDILESGREEIYFSAATAWEISIKARLGKLHLPGPPARRSCQNSWRSRDYARYPLPICMRSRFTISRRHHNDPFDRGR
jgi:PIN domain nuclease of toxin-antitoxin system